MVAGPIVDTSKTSHQLSPAGGCGQLIIPDITLVGPSPARGMQGSMADFMEGVSEPVVESIFSRKRRRLPTPPRPHVAPPSTKRKGSADTGAATTYIGSTPSPDAGQTPFEVSQCSPMQHHRGPSPPSLGTAGGHRAPQGVKGSSPQPMPAASSPSRGADTSQSSHSPSRVVIVRRSSRGELPSPPSHISQSREHWHPDMPAPRRPSGGSLPPHHTQPGAPTDLTSPISPQWHHGGGPPQAHTYTAAPRQPVRPTVELPTVEGPLRLPPLQFTLQRLLHEQQPPRAPTPPEAAHPAGEHACSGDMDIARGAAVMAGLRVPQAFAGGAVPPPRVGATLPSCAHTDVLPGQDRRTSGSQSPAHVSAPVRALPLCAAPAPAHHASLPGLGRERRRSCGHVRAIPPPASMAPSPRGPSHAYIGNAQPLLTHSQPYAASLGYEADPRVAVHYVAEHGPAVHAAPYAEGAPHRVVRQRVQGPAVVTYEERQPQDYGQPTGNKVPAQSTPPATATINRHPSSSDLSQGQEDRSAWRMPGLIGVAGADGRHIPVGFRLHGERVMLCISDGGLRVIPYSGKSKGGPVGDFELGSWASSGGLEAGHLAGAPAQAGAYVY